MIDVREIKLNRRYPESRQEDITDAFIRGYTGAVEIGNRAIEKLEADNAKLRELVVALYHIHFDTEEESWDAWEDFCPCGICEERHGGEAPCAHTAKDLADECCEPITKEIVTDRMRELGVDE